MSRPPELAEALALVLRFEHPNVNFAKLGTIENPDSTSNTKKETEVSLRLINFVLLCINN